ncbi:hypothetical protein [Mycoplasma suis]|uniref:Uncharacterized protein n=2 Tax=Mycoplasma suis TaxID=57372 RepID=F0QS39_MYCSL|nr:hypothetical protein [Mycoplasma suis]ADX98309.1 Conserved hypothetical protein [Mycoplasma suis str. Illinois]CBZ40824.1 hypothetical protein MSUIS_07310 [Mycoplasma suis KI3806]
MLEIESYTKSKIKKCTSKLKQQVPSHQNVFKFEGTFRGLTFFADFNKLDSYRAKKILLDYSWLREQNKQLLVLKKMNENCESEYLKEVVIKFDLSFLKDSHFFENDKYASFKRVLPPNLMIELPLTVEYEIEKIPESLKKEQLIDLSSLKMNIS